MERTDINETLGEGISIKTVVPVEIVNKSGNALPEYATNSSAGLDLRASFSNGNLNLSNCSFSDWDDEGKYLIIFSGGRALIPTDLFVGIPEGYEIQVRPRSGLALKHGVTVLNTPGTIDADYRGNVGVILINLGEEPFVVNEGDRIAQAVLSKHETISWNSVSELKKTERGEGGFGSTGKK